MPGRREFLAGLAVALIGARESHAAGGGVVHAPMPPCPREAGDVVAIMLRGAAPAGGVAVFGQVFRRGDVPRDTPLVARPMSGAGIFPVQVDVRTRYDDGSVRHAVISLATPALQGDRWTPLMLTTAADIPMARPITPAAALASRSAVVEILPANGAAPWRIDLAATVRERKPGIPPDSIWQSGPLAAQQRITLPVPAEAVGGAASPRLVADLAIRADGTLWLAAWVRNDLAMQPVGGTIEYALRIVLDGRQVLDTGPFRQAQYQGFGRTRAVGRDGAPAPDILVYQDTAYLAETGAIPLLDTAIGVDGRVLARLAQGMEAPEWNVPLAPRGFMLRMGTTGGRRDIGRITGWQAIWLMSGDPRAAAWMMGQGEAGGSIPWHFWDPRRDGWLSLDDYPTLWTDARGQVTLTQRAPRDTGWTVEFAHHPTPSAIPYILTGERWLLDNLQGQAAGVIMSTYPTSRRDGMGLVANGGQLRAMAWSLRDVDNAAWLSPDGTREQAYFRRISGNNWDALIARIPDWTARQGEPHGWIPGTVRGPGYIPPWQEDYFATTSAAAAARGNVKAAEFLRWQSNFLIGRFRNEANGFRPFLGVGYHLVVSDERLNQDLQVPLFRTWAELDRQTDAKGAAPSEPWKLVGYNKLALATLAELYNALALPAARELFVSLSAQMTGVSVKDYQKEPTFAFVPRGISRTGASPSCDRPRR